MQPSPFFKLTFQAGTCQNILIESLLNQVKPVNGYQLVVVWIQWKIHKVKIH